MLFFVRIDNFLDPKLAAVMHLFHSTFRFAVIFLLYSSWYCERKTHLKPESGSPEGGALPHHYSPSLAA